MAQAPSQSSPLGRGPAGDRRRPRRGLLLLLVPLLVALPYLGGLRNGFVWLDRLEIVEGELIVEHLSEIPDLFHDDRNASGYHRPFYDLLHSLDHALFGLDPFGYHLSSLLLHLANTALVVLVATALGEGTWRAGALALLWGLHPVNTASVGLIHAKADLFSLTCVLWSLALFLRGERRGTRVPWLGASLPFLVALYTKETAFVFPLGLGWWYLRTRRPALRTYALATGCLALVVGAGRVAAGGQGFASPLGLAERLATFTGVYVDYARKLVLPRDLSIADSVVRFGALGTAAQLRTLGAFLLLVACLVALWRRRPASAKWIVIYHLALLPVCQLVPILHFRADRFLYVPSLAFVGLVVGWLGSLEAPRRLRALALPAVALVAAVFGVLDARRVRDFRDDESLFGSELARRPEYLEGLSHMARVYDGQGRHERAEECYRACLAANPDLVSYFDGEGLVLAYSSNLLAQDRPADALALIERFGRAAASPLVREELAYNRAVALRRLGRHAEALAILTPYGERHPDDASCAFLVGSSALELGRDALARAALERYLRLAPGAPDAGAVRAALARLGDR